MGDALPIEVVCRRALVERLRNVAGPEAMLDGQSGYVADYRSNLVVGITPGQFESDLRQGSGNELEWDGPRPPKFNAAFSSSALAVNAFARWRGHERMLELCEWRGFDSLEFEARCPNGLARATPPNLDVLLKRGDEIVAIESKCLEYLRVKEAKFSSRYDELVASGDHDDGWITAYRALVREPGRYRYLDAAQLVKHYFGLKHTYPDSAVTLLYLYWEPEGVAGRLVFQAHRDEVADFASLVGLGAIRFRAMNYLDLWGKWEQLSDPGWLREHLVQLRGRYAVTITGP